MKTLLIESPLLLLFCIAGLGYLVGQIRVAGITLGVAAVLFVGLAVGALDPQLQLPRLIDQLGLVLFVYTIGLSSGATFFSSFKKSGVRDTVFIVAVLLALFAAAHGARALLGLPAPVVAGLFAGSLTNTPALAAVVDMLERGGAVDSQRS